jgi:hypothetical protein
MAGAGPEVRPDVIDAPLIKVPFESLKRAAKERKAYVDEAGEALSSLGRAGGSDGSTAPQQQQTSQQQQLAQLDQLLVQLQGLKRKLDDVNAQEAGDASR